MSLIKAFVGHSFTEEDAEVADKFLKFFARLEKMNTGFSWVHAEAAEPKQLADKVLSLIEDRNLFIGICTRKELAVRHEKLSNVPFLKMQLVSTEDFEWKTSDWIVQEIGLATGKDRQHNRRRVGWKGLRIFRGWSPEAPEHEPVSGRFPKCSRTLSAVYRYLRI